MRTPPLGVADNGDFWRVARPAGLEAVGSSRGGAFVVPRYEIGEPSLASLPTSPALVAYAARVSRTAVEPRARTLDVRRVGTTYWLLLCLTTAALLALGVPSAWVAVSLFVVSDPGYILFFNSFYAESCLFLALFFVTLWFLATDLEVTTARFWAPASLLWLFLLLGGVSKVLYSFLPAIAAGPAAHSLRRSSGFHRTILATVLALLAVASPLHFLKGSGPNFDWANRYHAVYAGLAVAEPDHKKVLSDLGLPDRFGDLPRRDVFAARIGPSHPVHQVLRDVSRLDVAAQYFSVPQRLQFAWRSVATELRAARSHHRGNTERSVEARRRTRYEPHWTWSRLRAAVFDASRYSVEILILGSILALACSLIRRSWSGRDSALLFLLGWCVSQAAMTVLGDGFVSLRQHLIGARLGLDLMLLLVGARSLEAVFRLVGRKFIEWRQRGRAGSRSKLTAKRNGLCKVTVSSFLDRLIATN